MTATENALALLRATGADHLGHPGGTLLAHLLRVRDRLATWGAREALQLAGLCHAFYGTDGFAVSLLPLERRATLRTAVGAEAEALVYLYASCDRTVSYPVLADDGGALRDRFTGGTVTPAPARRRDVAELTAANELDLAERDADFRQRWGPGLVELFARWDALLGDPARRDCRRVLGAGEGE